VTVAKDPKAPRLPTIKMDDEHHQVERDGPPPPVYTLPPTAEFMLDAEGYQLPYPPSLEGQEVNTIEIVLGKEEQFTTAWQHGVTKHRIAKDTLSAHAKKPFEGLKDGQTMMIGVGILSPDKSQLSVVWAALVEVRAKVV
jgi:hypothetical protein